MPASSERKGTLLFRNCLPEETALELIEHLAERTKVQAGRMHDRPQ